MKKEQRTLPNYADVIDAANAEIGNLSSFAWKKFRHCSAKYAETPRFYVLCSYRTIIAVVDKTTGILYDFLRAVYGYTNTSAQHIAKFRNDFCRSGKTIRIDCYEQLVRE